MVDYSNMTDEQLLAIVRGAPPANKFSVPSSAALGMMQGASLGWADEAAAKAAEKVLPLFGLQLPYEEGLKVAQSTFGQAERENPSSYMAGDIAGSIAAPAKGLSTAQSIKSLAALGGLYGGISGAGRAEEGRGLEGALAGAGIGALATPVIAKAVPAAVGGAKKAVQSVTRRPNVAARLQVNMPNLPAQIQDALSQMGDDAIAQFHRSVDEGLSPEQALFDAMAKKYNVPLSAGEKTASPALQSKEEDALLGLLGEKAQAVAQKHKTGQQAALTGAVSRIGGKPEVVSESELGQKMSEKIAENFRTSEKAATEAYKVMKSPEAKLAITQLKTIPEAIRKTIRSEKIPVRRMGEVRKVLGDIKRAESLYGDNMSIPLYQIDDFRQQIGDAIGKTSTSQSEKRALMLIKRSFDDAYKSALDSAGQSGLKKEVFDAIDTYAAHMQRFFPEGRKAKDLVGIVKGKATPEEVAQYAFGSPNSRLGIAKDASRKVGYIKNMLGQDSPEFAELQRNALSRISGIPLEQMSTGEVTKRISGAKVLSNAETFLANKSLADSLFTAEQQAQIKEVAQLANRALTRVEGAKNTSNTYTKFARMFGAIPKGLGAAPQMIPVVGPVYGAARQVAKEAADARTIQKLTSGAVPSTILAKEPSVVEKATRKAVTAAIPAIGKQDYSKMTDEELFKMLEE